MHARAHARTRTRACTHARTRAHTLTLTNARARHTCTYAYARIHIYSLSPTHAHTRERARAHTRTRYKIIVFAVHHTLPTTWRNICTACTLCEPADSQRRSPQSRDGVNVRELVCVPGCFNSRFLRARKCARASVTVCLGPCDSDLTTSILNGIALRWDGVG
jgi:hypothetical protein